MFGFSDKMVATQFQLIHKYSEIKIIQSCLNFQSINNLKFQFISCFMNSSHQIVQYKQKLNQQINQSIYKINLIIFLGPYPIIHLIVNINIHKFETMQNSNNPFFNMSKNLETKSNNMFGNSTSLAVNNKQHQQPKSDNSNTFLAKTQSSNPFTSKPNTPGENIFTLNQTGGLFTQKKQEPANQTGGLFGALNKNQNLRQKQSLPVSLNTSNKTESKNIFGSGPTFNTSQNKSSLFPNLQLNQHKKQLSPSLAPPSNPFQVHSQSKSQQKKQQVTPIISSTNPFNFNQSFNLTPTPAPIPPTSNPAMLTDKPKPPKADMGIFGGGSLGATAFGSGAFSYTKPQQEQKQTSLTQQTVKPPQNPIFSQQLQSKQTTKPLFNQQTALFGNTIPKPPAHTPPNQKKQASPAFMSAQTIPRQSSELGGQIQFTKGKLMTEKELIEQINKDLENGRQSVSRNQHYAIFNQSRQQAKTKLIKMLRELQPNFKLQNHVHVQQAHLKQLISEAESQNIDLEKTILQMQQSTKIDEEQIKNLQQELEKMDVEHTQAKDNYVDIKYTIKPPNVPLPAPQLSLQLPQYQYQLKQISLPETVQNNLKQLQKRKIQKKQLIEKNTELQKHINQLLKEYQNKKKQERAIQLEIVDIFENNVEPIQDIDNQEVICEQHEHYHEEIDQEIQRVQALVKQRNDLQNKYYQLKDQVKSLQNKPKRSSGVRGSIRLSLIH